MPNTKSYHAQAVQAHDHPTVARHEGPYLNSAGSPGRALRSASPLCGTSPALALVIEHVRHDAHDHIRRSQNPGLPGIADHRTRKIQFRVAGAGEVAPRDRGRLQTELLHRDQIRKRGHLRFLGIALRHHRLPVDLGADRVFELTHDRRETETRERPAQFLRREDAAEGDEPAQALMRAPMDVLKALPVVHVTIVRGASRIIPLTMIDLVQPESPELWAVAATLVREYAASLNVGLDFQHFDEELANLAEMYRPPGGVFLLAHHQGQFIGCGGIRRFSDAACEMKRLYVVPGAQKQGVGRTLALALIEEARRLRYSNVLLDTLPSMTRAQALYNSLGFVTVPSYRFNPVPGTAFMRLDL